MLYDKDEMRQIKQNNDQKKMKRPDSAGIVDVSTPFVDDDEPAVVLKQVFTQYGTSIIDDPKRIIGLVLDMCSLSEIELNVLELVLETKIIHDCVLKGIFDQDDQKRAAYYIISTKGLSDEWARRAVSWIAYSINKEYFLSGGIDNKVARKRTTPLRTKERVVRIGLLIVLESLLIIGGFFIWRTSIGNIVFLVAWCLSLLGICAIEWVPILSKKDLPPTVEGIILAIGFVSIGLILGLLLFPKGEIAAFAKIGGFCIIIALLIYENFRALKILRIIPEKKKIKK